MSLILIAALAKNRVIGLKGKIPWFFPEDFKRFKDLTLNHPVIMGRKTYESILERNGQPLKDRTNIVLSTTTKYSNILAVESLDIAICIAKSYSENIFIAGGQRVYEESISRANKMEITHIHKDYQGDAFFPEIKEEFWKETNRKDNKGFSFVTYERK